MHQSRRKSALQLKKIQQNEEEFLCEPSKKTRCLSVRFSNRTIYPFLNRRWQPEAGQRTPAMRGTQKYQEIAARSVGIARMQAKLQRAILNIP
jgi:hypothetical protein